MDGYAGMKDCNELISEMKHHDKQLRLKRRWLMDLHLSKPYQKQMKRLKPLNDMSLPESLLREDDVHYENIISSVAKAFGVQKEERTCHVALGTLLSNSTVDLRLVYSLFDKLNNKGLCCLAETVTGGSITFDKTNLQMRRIIKQYLPKIFDNHDDSSQSRIKKVSQILKDPQNFRVNPGICSTSESFRSAAMYVLDRLKELPRLTLAKVHRDIRGVTGYIPEIPPKRIDGTVKSIAKQIRKRCLIMLLDYEDYEEGEEPPEPLAKALSVAALMLKPKFDVPSQTVFRKFPPDIEALQNDIVKAIRIVDERKKLSIDELRNLPLVLDASVNNVSNIHLQKNVNKLLTEYLVECSDLPSIPDSLLETLAIINKKTSKRASKKSISQEVEEEVECVLNISAQMKQIVWDLLTESDVSEDFADAYMEKVEESYYEDERSCRSDSNVSYSIVESVGEINQSECRTPTTATRDDGSSSLLSPEQISVKPESVYSDEDHNLRSTVRQGRRDSFPSLCRSSAYLSPNEGSDGNYMEQKVAAGDLGCTPPTFTSAECSEEKTRQKSSRNKYLFIQEASDETSMFAYSLIGCMLNKFAESDGLQLSEDDVFYLQGNNTPDPKIFEGIQTLNSLCAASESEQNEVVTDNNNVC